MAILGKATIASTEQPYSDGKSLGRHLQIDDIGHAYLCMHITLLVYKSINVQGLRRRVIPTCEMLKMNQIFLYDYDEKSSNNGVLT